MLRLNGEDFTIGRSRFLDNLPGSDEATSKIYIKIRPGGLDIRVLAQLDTGSAWSIVETDIARQLNVLNGPGPEVNLNTRFGRKTGRLVRIPVEILADEGASLSLDATVFVCPDWPAGNFVGYEGLLNRIRIALDPRSNDFYFGDYRAA